MASKNHSDLTLDAFPSPPREVSDNTTETPSAFDQENKATSSPPLNKKKKKKSRGSNGTKPNFHISHCNVCHIGNNIVYNAAENRTANTPSAKKEPKTKAIVELLARTDPISDEILRLVSSNIGQNWKAFARLLHYNEAKIFQVKESNPNEGLEEVVYQLIYNWRNEYVGENEVGILVSALWKAKEYEVVKLMAEEYP